MFVLGNEKMARTVWCAIFFVALDRFAKMLSLAYLIRHQFPLLGNILKLEFAKNVYIAFSLPLGGRALLIVIFFILIVLLLAMADYYKKQQWRKVLPLLFVFFGASSNFYDRIRYGFVIDYFSLKYFTIFNIADMMIVGGVVLFIYYELKAGRK